MADHVVSPGQPGQPDPVPDDRFGGEDASTPVDIVISDVTIIDGTGGEPFLGDVGVRGDRIAVIGGPGTLSGGRRIDGTGRALAPGFIDVHTHDDFAVVLHPEMEFKTMGGVTTCVVGNCGFGAAPHALAVLLASALHPGHELPEWEGYSGYLSRLEQEPASVNVAALVGHGVVRGSVMGTDNRRPVTAELAAMCLEIEEGMEAGALGMSTGLIYEPGRYADTAELIDLCGPVADAGGLYATHMRDEGVGLLESVAEALEVGRRAGLPVQISHHKASGREAWGLVGRSLEMIEAARAEGLDVWADQYPYTAGSTILSAVAAMNGLEPESIVISSCEPRPEWESQSVADLARSWEVEPALAVERVLAEAPGTTVVLHSIDEGDVRTVMRHPTTMIGSDGLPTLEGKPHPRLYGTFARVLGHYSRDLGLFPLAEAVHRMTGLPAARFGLTDRGIIAPGRFADLVVFDPEAVIDRGTFADPKHYPAGIHQVLVNGRLVVDEGSHTGERPGAVLRRS